MDEQTLAKIAAARTLPDNPAPETGGFTSILDLWRRRAAENAEQEYLIFYGDDAPVERLTYADCWSRICQLANYLTHDLGLVHGDRLATLFVNHSDTVCLYYAAWCIGLTVVPINVEEPVDRMRFSIENSEARCLFVRRDVEAKVRQITAELERLEHVVAVENDGWDGASAFRKTVAAAPQELRQEREPTVESEAFIVYTSGTTGAPKGVLLNQGNLLVDAAAIAAWHKLTAGDRIMCVLPIHHVNGTLVTLLTPLFFGGSVVLNRRFRSLGFWQRVAQERVNVVSVVPTLLKFLFEADEPLAQLDLSAMRHFVCGAGPLTVELASQFEDRFRFPIVHGYGLSETTCYSCFLPIDLSPAEHRHWMRDYGFPSIGAPVPCNEMAIFDTEGKGIEVSEGERGEISIRGHNVMIGYFKRPEANAETFAYHWFRSGDEGFMKTDERGRRFFFITGRIKELIIRGGVNISPFELDEALQLIPGVKAAIAVGFENDYLGEEVGAYVQLEPGAALSEADVQEHCRNAGLPFAKIPKVVFFGDDIPVTSTGKYQRNRLQHLFSDYRARQFRG